VPKVTIPEQELMYSGHVACPGCGGALVMRYLLKALGPRTIVSIPAYLGQRWTRLESKMSQLWVSLEMEAQQTSEFKPFQV